jgi:hypothetical protein
MLETYRQLAAGEWLRKGRRCRRSGGVREAGRERGMKAASGVY